MKKIVFAAFCSFALAFSGCNSGMGGGSPKEVLTHFFDALANKNIDEAKKYATKDSEGMMNMMAMGMQYADDSSNVLKAQKDNMVIGDAVITGDKASVPVKDKRSGESVNFTLKKENGSWKVAFDMTTLMEMGRDKMKEKGMDMNMDSLNAAMPDMKDKMDQAQKMLDSASKMMDKMKKEVK